MKQFLQISLRTQIEQCAEESMRVHGRLFCKRLHRIINYNLNGDIINERERKMI